MCSYDNKGLNTFYLTEGTLMFKLRQVLCSIKFFLARQLIRALGYPALANKVWSGWQVTNAPSTLFSAENVHLSYSDASSKN